MIPKTAMKTISGALAVCGLMLVSGCYSSALDAASHIALEAANRAPGPGSSGSVRPASRKQASIDAYTIEQCVVMLSANPPGALSGSNDFGGSPAVLRNRCSNATFVMRICYNGIRTLLLDEETHDRVWNTEGSQLACRAQKYEIVPRRTTRIHLAQEERQALRDNWNRAFKN